MEHSVTVNNHDPWQESPSSNAAKEWCATASVKRNLTLSDTRQIWTPTFSYLAEQWCATVSVEQNVTLSDTRHSRSITQVAYPLLFGQARYVTVIVEQNAQSVIVDSRAPWQESPTPPIGPSNDAWQCSVAGNVCTPDVHWEGKGRQVNIVRLLVSCWVKNNLSISDLLSHITIATHIWGNSNV